MTKPTQKLTKEGRFLVQLSSKGLEIDFCESFPRKGVGENSLNYFPTT